MANIKELRKRTGCTQKEAAQILGVALRTMQDWESGKRSPKNPEEVEERLEALTHLTRDGINSILSGLLDLDWAIFEKKISDKEYILSARMSVRELNRKYEFGLPEDDSYETLAGLILYTAESFPKEKEILQIGNISLTILKTSKKRIETISLKID